ncbi:MAG: penicillin-binding transpeptidase domain-containing protein [Planctomycetota bacterium]
MSRGVSRIRILAVLLVLAGLGLVLRLQGLQLAEHESWLEARERNMHRVEWLPGRRGRILDRAGRVLAEDATEFVLNLNYKRFRKEHPLGLVLHLEHLVRDIRERVDDRIPLLLEREERLSYRDPPEAFLEVLARLTRLPSQWLHKRGPLVKQLSSHLRFYAFRCLEPISAGAHGERLSQAKLSGLFHERKPEPDEQPLLEVLAPYLGDSMKPLGEWLRGGMRDLRELEKQLLAMDAQAPLLRERLDRRDRYLSRLTESKVRRLVEAARRNERDRSWFAALTDWLRDPGEPRLDGIELEYRVRFSYEDSPRRIQKAVPFDTVVALVAGRKERYPGFELGETVERRYPRSNPSGHPYRFLGLVGCSKQQQREQEEEVPASRGMDEKPGRRRRNFSDSEWRDWKERLEEQARQRNLLLSRNGLAGVEKALDRELRGEWGLRQFRMNRRGRELAMPRHYAAVTGRDIRLTVDAELQDHALQALRSARDAFGIGQDIGAALVLLDARSGEIRCMAWLPELIREARDGKVVVNRWTNLATQFYYNSYIGSTLKPFVLLEELMRGRSQQLGVCPGRIRDGSFVRCHGHPPIRAERLVEDVLKYSCNVYFVGLGRRIGLDGIRRAAARFGLWTEAGEPFEAPRGLSLARPGPRRGEHWTLGRRAIGYGLWAAPLSVARAYAGLGTGRLPPYRLVLGDARASGEGEDLQLDAGFLERIREGLRQVIRPGGTADDSGLSRYRVAGKTGTAEVSGGKRNNAWFAGYLPSEQPRLAFCAVFYGVREKIWGGKIAARAVRELLDRIERQH